VKGDPRAKAAGAKGGRVTAEQRRAATHGYTGTILDVADAAGMVGPSWVPARTILKAAFGLPLDPVELVFFQAHTQRTTPPTAPVSEAWLCAGRRAGKSRLAAVIAFYLGIRFDPARLAPGELAVVPILAADRKQSRVTFSYLRALCQLDQFKPFVNRVLRDMIELSTGVNVEVMTASYQTIRGYTIPAAVLDELAFWSDEGTNPDSAVLDALRPGMATVPDALLWAISSPYARRGELYETYSRYFGTDDPHVLVLNADTRSLNPAVPERVIARAFEEDPVAAASEYGQDGRVVFRHDVESFLDPQAVEAVVVQGRRELPPLPDVEYEAFVDPSGGSQDSFTLAIAHGDDEGRGILDLVRETRPPFSPDSVVQEYAALLKSYGCVSVVGDRYAGEWPRERFRVHGIDYVPAEHSKSDLYREIVAPLNAGRLELLDLPVLKAQVVGLERRVARGGKDSIDHSPGGRDDVSNAAVGSLTLVVSELQVTTTKTYPGWIGR
jgi:hypothetical protein